MVPASLLDGVGVGVGAVDAVGAAAPLADGDGVVGAAGAHAVRSKTAPTAAIRGSRVNMQKGYRRYTDLYVGI
jgi:hypothetical protein